MQEVINLTPLSLRLNKPATIELFGKGAKTRIVPLDHDMVGLLTGYIKETGLDNLVRNKAQSSVTPGEQRLPIRVFHIY